MNSIKDIFETMDWGPAPESDAPAQAWLDARGRRFGHFIGGAFIEGEAHFETLNPATAQPLAQIAQGTDADVDAAVAAARKAQPAWWKLGGHGRARHLYALARLVQKHSRLLAVLETLDNGKPIRESRDIDVPLVARHFSYHASAAQLLEVEFPGHVPHGVAGQIIPWNFPLLMLAWKVAPALACGNTVVLKPAEQTPLTALLFAELCMEAGLPAGVVNIVTGDGRTGAAITRHEGINKLAFTGSTEVGRIIRKDTAGSGKALTLELGGKSPYIVFDDADIDSAVEGLVDAIWFNGGQVCCAGSRLLVQEGIAQGFEQKLIARMNRLRVGNPLDKAIDMGAIVDAEQLARIRGMVALAPQDGGEAHVCPCPLPNQGYFHAPTLITGLSTASRLMQEEIFGPVLVSTTFRTPAEAVALANNSSYGLAASIWTENVNLALDIAPRLACGVAWVNATNLFDAAAGFGGRKESGFGREGGGEGLLAYLRPAHRAKARPLPAPAALPAVASVGADVAAAGVGISAAGSIDRTPKMYVGGKQARPDGGNVRPVLSPRGALLGHVGDGNRKDIRNAVEAAARAQPGWARATAHLRAQILYFVAENLSARAGEFADRLRAQTGAPAARATREVEAAIARLFSWAAWSDRHEGRVHPVPIRGLALAVNEPVGVIGAICPEEAPLLGFVSVMAPIIALGNAAVLVPSARAPLSATDFYQVLDTSDVPGGVVNIVTGDPAALAPTLAEHHEVRSLWSFGSASLSAEIERRSAASLKRSWVNHGLARDWFDRDQGEGAEFRAEATDIKNIWVPWGE